MRNKPFALLLLLLILLENLCLFVFYKNRILGQQLNSSLYFLSGIIFGLALIFRFYNKPVMTEEKHAVMTTSRNKTFSVIAIVVAACVSLLLVQVTFQTLQKIKIDYRNSDIIPAIEIMVTRFLHGKYPYSAMTELGYSTPAGYMPMHWMPFCISELCYFDYRWLSFGLWYTAMILITVRCWRRVSASHGLLIFVLLSAVYYLISLQTEYTIGFTAEILIAAYYMVLIAGISQRNPWLEGLSIALCVLSRYTILLWLPLWFLTLLVSWQKKQLIKASLSILAMVLALYIIPFLSKNWTMFFTTASAYSNLSWEWQHGDDNGTPYHLYNGIGFAYLFFEKYRATDYMIGFNLLRSTFFVLTCGSVLLMGTWYWLNKTKIHYQIFLLASFKIYLSIFLSLIVVPYEYLMITGSFVSIAIFAEQLGYTVTGHAEANKKAVI